MDGMKNILEKFKNLSLVKKAAIFFSLFFVVIVVILLLASEDEIEYSFLYRDLAQEDAASISKELKVMKIPYKVTNSGNIMVPSEKVAKLRLTLAQKKLVGNGIGFEILDKQKYGMTSFMERLNYLRALQGELSKTINQLSAVVSSRVHIVLPKKAIFREDDREATASIVLKLKKNDYLTKKQIEGVLFLVAGSIEGLKKENISIVDTNGNKLNQDNNNGIDKTPLEYQKRYEEKLRKQVQDILDRALGVGNAIVKVEALLDFDKKAKSEESYDPDATAIRSEKLLDEKKINGENKIGGIPGSESNNPENGTAKGTITKGNSGEKTRNSQIRNYEVSKVVKSTKSSIGNVKKISVAVLINGSYKKDKKGNNIYVPRTEKEIKTLLNIVKNAVGYDLERGDQVEVANMPFKEVKDDVYKPTPFYKKSAFYFKISKYLFYILLLLVAFLILRKILNWATMREEVLDINELEASNGLMELSESEKEIIDALNDGETGIEHLSTKSDTNKEEDVINEESLEAKLRKKINEIAYENPENVLQILRYWINNG